MKFPGVEQFLVRYRERAGAAGVDPLGLYIPPYAYAEMQILKLRSIPPVRWTTASSRP